MFSLLLKGDTRKGCSLKVFEYFCVRMWCLELLQPSCHWKSSNLKTRNNELRMAEPKDRKNLSSQWHNQATELSQICLNSKLLIIWGKCPYLICSDLFKSFFELCLLLHGAERIPTFASNILAPPFPFHQLTFFYEDFFLLNLFYWSIVDL